eukprot:CAMPEP_0185846446 /NCGR_PEP_ID=MMETSP1354-20130828/2077_1 /TAXON_ID=708628 /ORGANISM="Erythrolobus madagascarensis, Strain CCMP3276" /LENGTH=912 /DNA_ID=CAMNT_0028546577 /DNA_START=157 /DNA_END=2895 /DNA_ORIENTATION=+
MWRKVAFLVAVFVVWLHPVVRGQDATALGADQAFETYAILKDKLLTENSIHGYFVQYGETTSTNVGHLLSQNLQWEGVTVFHAENARETMSSLPRVDVLLLGGASSESLALSTFDFGSKSPRIVVQESGTGCTTNEGLDMCAYTLRVNHFCVAGRYNGKTFWIKDEDQNHLQCRRPFGQLSARAIVAAARQETPQVPDVNHQDLRGIQAAVQALAKRSDKSLAQSTVRLPQEFHPEHVASQNQQEPHLSHVEAFVPAPSTKQIIEPALAPNYIESAMQISEPVKFVPEQHVWAPNTNVQLDEPAAGALSAELQAGAASGQRTHGGVESGVEFSANVLERKPALIEPDMLVHEENGGEEHVPVRSTDQHMVEVQAEAEPESDVPNTNTEKLVWAPKFEAAPGAEAIAVGGALPPASPQLSEPSVRLEASTEGESLHRADMSTAEVQGDLDENTKEMLETAEIRPGDETHTEHEKALVHHAEVSAMKVHQYHEKLEQAVAKMSQQLGDITRAASETQTNPGSPLASEFASGKMAEEFLASLGELHKLVSSLIKAYDGECHGLLHLRAALQSADAKLVESHQTIDLLSSESDDELGRTARGAESVAQHQKDMRSDALIRTDLEKQIRDLTAELERAQSTLNFDAWLSASADRVARFVEDTLGLENTEKIKVGVHKLEGNLENAVTRMVTEVETKPERARTVSLIVAVSVAALGSLIGATVLSAKKTKSWNVLVFLAVMDLWTLIVTLVSRALFGVDVLLAAQHEAGSELIVHAFHFVIAAQVALKVVALRRLLEAAIKSGHQKLVWFLVAYTALSAGALLFYVTGIVFECSSEVLPVPTGSGLSAPEGGACGLDFTELTVLCFVQLTMLAVLAYMPKDGAMLLSSDEGLDLIAKSGVILQEFDLENQATTRESEY